MSYPVVKLEMHITNVDHFVKYFTDENYRYISDLSNELAKIDDTSYYEPPKVVEKIRNRFMEFNDKCQS